MDIIWYCNGLLFLVLREGWTCSNLLFRFSVWGDQTLAQYSRFDLTMDLYAKVLVTVFWIGRFRLKKPMILFAFEVMLLIWVSQFNDSLQLITVLSIEKYIMSSPVVFSGVHVTRSLTLCVCFVDRCLSFCPFYFCHCVVCSSSIYGFWLPLWYLLATVLSVLLRSMDSDYLLLVSFGHCVVCSSSIYWFWLPLLYLQTLLAQDKYNTMAGWNQ